MSKSAEWAAADESEKLKRFLEGTEEYCTEHLEGHEPDLTTITRDPQAPDGVVGVACTHCGRSGSVFIDPTDVDW